MSSTQRWILAALLAVVLSLAGTVGLAATTAVRHGMIRVQVEPDGEHGEQVDVAVPAALVELAILLAPIGLIVDRAPLVEIRPYAPVLRELPQQIERLPDGVFVEVNRPNQRIHVEKSNGRIIVRVETGQESIDVTVPVSTVVRALRKARRLI